MWAAASGDAGAVVADLDQDPVAVAGGAHGQPAVPMAGERSWANPAPMHFPNKANDDYRAARRSTRRR
jgi:hypothetical protein